MKNDQAILDTTKLMTGKDGRVFCNVGGVDIFLSEVDTFQAQFNFTNTDYQPVGSLLVFGVPTGVSATLTMTEAVIRDDVTMGPIIEAVKNGVVPTYSFQGGLERPDGGEERILFNNCIPDGAVDLMNLTPGEIIKRAWSFRVNSIPKHLKELLQSV